MALILIKQFKNNNNRRRFIKLLIAKEIFDHLKKNN